MNWGVKILQTFALPLGHGTKYEKRNAHCIPILFGAGDEARTRYLHLGKVALYRMSYTRKSIAGIIIANNRYLSSLKFLFYSSPLCEGASSDGGISGALSSGADSCPEDSPGSSAPVSGSVASSGSTAGSGAGQAG